MENTAMNEYEGADDEDDDGCCTAASTGDDLSELSRSHNLPSHILHLRRADLVDGEHLPPSQQHRASVSVHTISTVLRGSQFGPFTCRLVERGQTPRIDNAGASEECRLELVDSNETSLPVVVDDEAGRWLQLMRTTDSIEHANVAVSLQDGHVIQCRVTKDIPADDELVAMLTVCDRAPSTSTSSSSVVRDTDPAGEASTSPLVRLRTPVLSHGDDAGSEADNAAQRSKEDRSADRSVIQTPSTDDPDGGQCPAPAASHRSVTTTSRKKDKPTTRPSSSFPTHAAISSDMEQQRRSFSLIHVCVFCGVRFSSPRTLQAHIANYCSRKPFASAAAPAAAINPAMAATALAGALSLPPPPAVLFTPPPAQHQPPPHQLHQRPDVTSPGLLLSAVKSHDVTKHVVAEDDTENQRKRRAADDSIATAKVSRKGDDSDHMDDDIECGHSGATVDPVLSPRTGSSNGDAACDRKQSPLTCPHCDYTADERCALSRHVRAHSCPRSATSTPEVNDDDDIDVETEDDIITSSASATTGGDKRELFCVDCHIQFTSPGTYRAHRTYYCRRSSKRDANDDEAGVRGPRRASGNGPSVTDRSGDFRPFAGLAPALFPPSLAAMSSHAGLMDMFAGAGAPPPPPPPGAFFLAPFLAAAAAAAAAGVPANGLPGAVTNLQQSASSLPAGNRAHQPSADRCSTTSASDDEPLDLSTCRYVSGAGTDNKNNTSKQDVPFPAVNTTLPPAGVALTRQFAGPGIDALDASSLFLPPSARLPLTASVPLPGVRAPLTSPPSISHCHECNIVFYKHANYLAHKAHYCSGRHVAPAAGSGGAQDQARGVAGPPAKSAAVLKGDGVARGSAGLDDGRRKSPDPRELVATLDDTGTTIQFYCIPCKIKFSSLDTLRAHKQFYCPSRFEAPSGVTSGEPATSGSSARHRHTSRAHSGSDDSDRTTEEQIQSGSGCNTCGTSSRSGHRCQVASASQPTPALYQCPHCDYAAQSDTRLVEHVRAHAPSRAFRCALCGYRGNTVRGMRMHGKMHNDEAAAAAGRAGNAVQLPTFTDDCVIEYEEPPAIPPRRHAGSASGSSRPGLDSELLRQKNEPYKRRRSRKAYEKAEYSTPAGPATPVVCAECSAPLLDTAHAQAHASAHAAERLLAWEALYGAVTGTQTPTTATVLVCKPDVDADPRKSISPAAALSCPDETTAKPMNESLLATVKVEKPDSIDAASSTADVVDDRKCNGTDMAADDDQKSTDAVDAKSSTPPSDVVDASGPSTCLDGISLVDGEAGSESAEAGIWPVGDRSPPPLSDVRRCGGIAERPSAVPRVAAVTAAVHRQPTLDVGSRYCEQCDITFMYASTFVAHKKYYCSSHAAERTETAARASAAAAGVAV